MIPLSVTDAMFLLAEARERPMHVGGLQLFTLPDGAGPDYLEGLYRRAVESDQVNSLFRRRPHRSLTTLGQWAWVDDDALDLEYHVRHSALPMPGRVRELLALTSQLHGSLLDRHRPLWEFHLIEGLEGARFATYAKMHHAMVDGVAGLRLLRDSLSEDPEARDVPMPFAMPRPARARGARSAPNPLNAAVGALRAAGDAAAVTQVVYGSIRKAVDDATSASPFRAPRTMFNTRITGARRFAADSWEFDRVRVVGKAADATVNTVALAMCSGALRAYLDEQDGLPDQPLVAMVPMSLRSSDEAVAAGNAVGAILCNLATDVADPADRLERIKASMRHAKERMAGLTPSQIVAYSVLMTSGVLLGPLLRGAMVRPPFNLVISNVPGPRQPLWWNGARLDGIYPVSIPTDGQALNITLTSYVDNLEFGLTGCHRSVPHLQRMLVHLEDSLAGLEKAVE
ncbi:MAG: WS/DGAT/MGAT family O-acyltransferase [Acidimicrobiales bacterium]